MNLLGTYDILCILLLAIKVTKNNVLAFFVNTYFSFKLYYHDTNFINYFQQLIDKKVVSFKGPTSQKFGCKIHYFELFLKKL